MSFLETLLLALILLIVLPAVFSIFLALKLREEKKLPSEECIRTQFPKAVSGFFLGFAILVLCGGIAGIVYCCVTEGVSDPYIVIIIAVAVAIFSALGFFGYSLTRFNYVIADNEGITVCRIFHKQRYYRYEEIGYFHNGTGMGILGNLTAYDKADKKIFQLDSLSLRAEDVVKRLNERGVNERFPIRML